VEPAAVLAAQLSGVRTSGRRTSAAGTCDKTTWLWFAAVAVAAVWVAATAPVFAQEAYYWTYAQQPALGYYDHPPMVAWLIALGTSLFGDGALGLRAGTVACALGLTWFGLRWLRGFGGDAWTQRAWIALSFGVPMLAAGHFLATPDPPLCLFWAATIHALWQARRSARLRWWLLAGVAAGAALLSKYSAVFLAAGGVAVLLGDAQLRRQVRTVGPWLALAASILTFAPVLAWNAQHDFASFRFQTGDRYEKAQLGWHWLLEFVAGQAAVLSPLVATLLPLALAWWWRRWRAGDVRGLWLLAFALPLPSFFFVNSLWLQVKINWLMPAFAPLLVAGLLWWRSTRWDLGHPRFAGLVRASVWVVGALCVLVPMLEFVPNQGSTWSGWDRIAEAAERLETRIDDADGVEGNVFFFALNYRDAAQLRRSLVLLLAETEPGEVLEPILAQNVVGRPALQFDNWETPARRIGQDAVLVLRHPERRTKELKFAAEHFDSVEHVKHVSVTRLWYVVNEADIYFCRHYRGPCP
jgi:hypothetical protein